MNGYSYLTLEQRREIERMYAEGERVVDIAARLKRSAAAIYEELKRGYTGEFDGYARPKYSADLAQATAQENFRRVGFLCVGNSLSPIVHKRRRKRAIQYEDEEDRKQRGTSNDRLRNKRIYERVYLRSGMRLSEAGHLQGLV